MDKDNLESDDISFEDESNDGPSEGDELSRAARKSDRQKKELETCRAEKQEYLDGWQRARADLQNARKQFEIERREVAHLVEQEYTLDLLKVLDSFEMAFANREAWEKVDANWRRGVEYIHQQFLSVLEERGVTSFAPLGENFDPEQHESVSIERVENPEQDHKILKVLQRGYRYKDKVIRPAKVIVGHIEE